MKNHPKAKSIQQHYRTELAHQKKKSRYSLEAIAVMLGILFVLIFQWNNANKAEILALSDTEKSWFEVTPHIEEYLESMFSEYEGIAIDVNDETKRLILKTSFVKSDEDVEGNLTELVNVTNRLLGNATSPSKDETYMIIVRGENEEELIRKVFNGK
ncbi:hypothetical protein [Jeotgalibacillus salarius]|uniref:Uncharacterized protein n=1 Tax=Jeotgalibacillus salarius TaxID=546023 RepID=A0A4Y8LD59_9BACL|nr:hypothetical protein [Jeotgalibacillus salarius]TFE00630.1 hypothetical protein E2626_11695 [Jeotgalibacillus salarius]